MGVGKKVVTGKAKKSVEKATSGIPVVGDVVDKSINSGPMDKVSDDLDDAKDQLDDGVKKTKKKAEKAVKDVELPGRD